MKTLYKLCLTAVTSLLLIACQSGPAPQHYFITPDDQAITASHAKPKPALRVEPVKSSAILNTTQMEYKRHDNQVEFYTQSQWSIPVPRMIQDLMVESLVKSGRFSDVISAPSDLSTPLRLDLHLYTLEQDFTKSPYKAIARMHVRLVDTHNQRIIRSKMFFDEETILDYNAKAGVEAYNRLFSRMIPKVIDEIAR